MRENSEKFVSCGALQTKGEWLTHETIEENFDEKYLHLHHYFVEKNAISQVGNRFYERTSLESIISLQQGHKVLEKQSSSIARSKFFFYHCSTWPVLHQHCLQTVKRTKTTYSKQRSPYPNDKRTLKKSFCSRHAFKRSVKFTANYTQSSAVTVRCSSKPPVGSSSPHWCSHDPSGQNITLWIEICNPEKCQSCVWPIRNAAITLETYVERKTMRNFCFSFKTTNLMLARQRLNATICFPPGWGYHVCISPASDISRPLYQFCSTSMGHN